MDLSETFWLTLMATGAGVIGLIISPIIPAPVANTVSQNVSVKSIIILT